MRILKRGQVSDQFNWLFVAIAGGVILMFFFFVIVQVQTAGEAKLHAVVLGNMDAILTGSQVSPNTLNRIESSETLRFDISCDNFSSVMSVPRTQSQVDISRKIVFAPGVIGSNQIYVYVRPIERPMYVDNAIYLADTRTFFLVMGGNQTESSLRDLYLQIPDGIPKSGTMIFEERLRAYDTIVVVSETEPPEALQNEPGGNTLRNKNVNWITIRDNDVYMATKTDRQREFGPSEFVATKDNAFGVMFSRNPEFFRCTQKKIDERTRVVAKVYEVRTQNIANNINIDACKIQLNTAEGHFATLATNASNTDAIQGLRDTNNQLIRLSCPVAY